MLYESFLHRTELKLTLMGLQGYPSFATCGGIFRGSMGSLLVLSLRLS